MTLFPLITFVCSTSAHALKSLFGGELQTIVFEMISALLNIKVVTDATSINTPYHDCLPDISYMPCMCLCRVPTLLANKPMVLPSNSRVTGVYVLTSMNTENVDVLKDKNNFVVKFW